MIALDSSAIVAIALAEPEMRDFNALIARREALVGTPTLFETYLVLEQRIAGAADEFLSSFIDRHSIHPVAFNLPMYQLAQDAFGAFGKGKGHPAKLNFGDCMSYAVAKFHDVPLLFKGDDFRLTDIRPAVS
jgi:ribonuclease VapC